MGMDQIEVTTAVDQVDAIVDATITGLADAVVSEITLHLSNGVVVKILPPPSMALQLMTSVHETPQPPMVTNDVDGKVWMEANPNDPTYIAALAKHREEIGEATIRLMLWTSVKIVSFPDDFLTYDQDSFWEEELLELLDVVAPKSPRLHKIMWMRYRLFGVVRDFQAFQDACDKLSGVPEAAVVAAENRFPS